MRRASLRLALAKFPPANDEARRVHARGEGDTRQKWCPKSAQVAHPRRALVAVPMATCDARRPHHPHFPSGRRGRCPRLTLHLRRLPSLVSARTIGALGRSSLRDTPRLLFAACRLASGLSSPVSGFETVALACRALRRSRLARPARRPTSRHELARPRQRPATKWHREQPPACSKMATSFQNRLVESKHPIDSHAPGEDLIHAVLPRDTHRRDEFRIPSQAGQCDCDPADRRLWGRRAHLDSAAFVDDNARATKIQTNDGESRSHCLQYDHSTRVVKAGKQQYVELCKRLSRNNSRSISGRQSMCCCTCNSRANALPSAGLTRHR